MFRTGYITSPRGDLVWFLGLPIFALLFALASQQWLTAVAILSIGLWIEYPHHFATFLRTYALRDDWVRFKERLIVGPIVLLTMALIGYQWAPLTLTLVLLMWNQQHFVMQLHGFTRIYDFKARTGADSTPRWDFALNWMLYANMFLTTPLFSRLWIHELYRFGLPISADGVRWIQAISWGLTIVCMLAYAAHAIISVRQGHALNPIKFLFLGLTYGVLYYVAFHTASVLVHAVANMIIHGVQYNVIVYWYLRRQADKTGQKKGLVAQLVRPGNALAFIVLCLMYAVFYQMVLAGRPLDEFGFGIITSSTEYGAIPSLGLMPLSKQLRFEVFALAILRLPGVLHLYFDSFIWKVRDRKIQGGL